MNGGTRLVPRGAWSTGVPRDDFWLFDDERLWLMDYDPAGGFEAARLVDDPATVARHRHWRDAALTASMSLADYAAVHEPVCTNAYPPGHPHPASPLRAHRAPSPAAPRDGRDRCAVRRAPGRGWGQPKVSKIETGKQLPTAADVEAWAAATHADAPELLELLSRARIEYATFQVRYLELAGADRLQDAIGAAEAAASRIAHYEPVLVPGILQTADYARELLHLPSGPAASGASEGEISRMIASRLRRQAILYETSRDITILMGEGALRTRVASPAVMRAQREHVARLAESLTTATIGVVPFTAQVPIASLNGWLLTDDLATVETDAGNVEIADPSHVEGYWHQTVLLLEAAAVGADAADLCRSMDRETSGAAPAR